MTRRRLSLSVVLILLTFVATTSGCGFGRRDPASLARDLRSSEVETRRHAARQLAGLGSAAASAVPDLIAALRDPDRHVRKFAASALASIGPRASAAVESLAVVVESDEGAFARSAALKALGSIGPSAVGVADRIVDATEGGRVPFDEALTNLERMGPGAAGSLARIEAVEFAARVARVHQDRGAVEHLRSLGARAAPAVSDLAAIVADESAEPELRSSAATALGAIGVMAKSATPALERATAAGVRGAADALRSIRGK